MPTTVQNARDEIYALIQAAWVASGTSAFLVFDDMKGLTPDNQNPWARASVRHTSGGEISISGGVGKRRYNRTGTLYVNLFAQPGDGLRALDPLVKIVLDAYEGKTTPSGVWFTKAQVRELGLLPSPGYYQLNVLVNFSYDEIK
jgi:hypothetical protein